MEELGAFWNYQPFDELNQQIAYANLEVELLKMQLNEKLKMKKDLNEELENIREQVKNLFNLVNISYKEKEELRNLILNTFFPSSQNELPNSFPEVQPESLALIHPTKANSSITESNSFSHGSSPVSSPEFSNINVVDSNNMGYVNVRDYNGSAFPAFVSKVKPSTDPWDNVIESISSERGLPQKGELLQAVMDAGPLLQTIIVSGPLPRWRNPPPPQPIKVPSFVIKEFEIPNSELKTVPDTLFLKPLVSSSNDAISRTTFQHSSAAMLNSAATPSAAWNNAPHFISNPIFNNQNQVPSNKRQRRH